MLKAKDNSGNEKLAYEFPLPEKKNYYFCPSCNGRAIFVDAKFKIKHFRHFVEQNCNPEPETMEHIKMKKFFVDKLKLKKEQIEVDLGYARPDLFIDNVAIEVQHSKIPYDSFIQRTTNYSENKVHVLWIFHWKLLKENVPVWLLKAHELYFGRVYIFKNENIYPVHFNKKKRYVQEYYNEFTGEFYEGYSTVYKRKREYSWRKNYIKDFSLLKKRNTFKDNNFLIATFNEERFWD